MPVVREKDPSCQVKRVQCPRSVEGSRQPGEIRLGEFLSPPEQASDDKEISIGKKRTAEFRHRDRIRRVDDSSYGKDADRKIGGPRYLLGSISSGRCERFPSEFAKKVRELLAESRASQNEVAACGAACGDEVRLHVGNEPHDRNRVRGRVGLETPNPFHNG